MKLKYHLFCLITIGIFSTLEFVSKKLGGGLSPFTITAWRFLIGGLVLLPFAIRQSRADQISLKTGSILTMGALGILNVCLSMLLLQLAIHFGKASLSAILVSINPLFVSIFAVFIIKERLDFKQIAGLILGSLGLIAIIMGERELRTGSYLNLTLGIILALVAAMTFGLYTVLTKKTVMRYGNLLTNSVSFLLGAVMLFIVNALIGKPVFFVLTWELFLGIAYLGVFITGIAYLLYFEGMKGLTAAKASQYFFLKPVLASLLAYLFLSETLSMVQLIGMGFVIVSLSFKAIANLFFPMRTANS